MGLKPAEGSLDLTGLEIASESLKEAMSVKPQDWAAELDSQEEFFKKIGASVPAKMEEQRKALRAGLGSSLIARLAPSRHRARILASEGTRMLAVETHLQRPALAA